MSEMPPDLLQLLLGGTLLTSLGAGIKYVVDLVRTTSKERSPAGLAINVTAAAESSISLMSKVNDELTDENARLRKALQEADEREARLKAEVSRLEARVHELQASITALSSEIASFRNELDTTST